MLVEGLLLLVVYGLMCESSPPPQRPPQHLLEEFTLNGQVPIQFYYVDDSNKGRGTHYKYSNNEISEMIDEAGQFVSTVLSAPLPPSPHLHSPHISTWLTQLTDVWLVHALHTHGVTGMKVVVFGSTSPWYESLALAMGALHVTTIEYNQLTYDHPNMTTLRVSDMGEFPTHFQRALSLSSFDHDGLGRYGDPINPKGDLVAMETTKTVLEDDGILFLTVPIGPDLVVWNLHRRYGNNRLPLLLSGWEEVDRVGWSEALATQEDVSYTNVYEPVFVLTPQNKTIQ